MKIHLTVEQPCKNGYVWASPENTDLKVSDFYNCWEFCMESECTHLYAPTILEIFRTSEIEEILPKWASLIRKDGKITIGGTDLYLLSRQAIRRDKDLGSLNDMLFHKPYAVQSITSTESTAKFLRNLGFKIVNMELDENNCTYVVEGIKV